MNVSVLGAAKETYIKQLKIVLTPLIHEGFVSLWEDAQNKEIDQGGYNFLRQFQIFLKDIPNWNKTILEEETKRILKKIDFLMELVAGIFVSHVKILSSVRLNGRNREIRIKIPTAEVFIHTVYTNAAEMIYYNPFVFQNHSERKNYEEIREFIEKSINDTIDSMIPIESIVKEYLSSVFSGHVRTIPKEEPESEPETDRTSDFPHQRMLTSDDMLLKDEGSDYEFKNNDDDDDDTPLNSNFGTSTDPFINKSETDPFASSASSDPFAPSSSDPFSSASDNNSSDPFASVSDNTSSDPFATSTNNESTSNELLNEPFSAPTESTQEDPFTTPSETPSNEPDPFASNNNSSDPFASNNNSSDPFASTSNEPDPFASTNSFDPFASSSTNDPFSSIDVDPFKDLP
jgi:hypothetical protein